MNVRRIALVLATALIAPLVLLASAPSAQALGKRTKTWDTGTFEASITVNWLSKTTFEASGWIKDTKCDSRGVYLDRLLLQKPLAGGGYDITQAWGVYKKDANGCNNGKVFLAKGRYGAGKEKVPLLRVEIYSEDKSGDPGDRLTYVKVFNNPYIDG